MRIFTSTTAVAFDQRWDDTNKLLARIADCLERLAPRVADDPTGDNEPVTIDEYTPEVVDESAELKGDDEPK